MADNDAATRRRVQHFTQKFSIWSDNLETVGGTTTLTGGEVLVEFF